MDLGGQDGLGALEVLGALGLVSKRWSLLGDRLFQVVQGLQEHLGLPLDQALPPVHSLVVQLVLQVLGTQGCQDLLENPGPPSHQ